MAAPTAFCFVCQKQPAEGGSQLQRCGGCKYRWFCSRECQKKDWTLHKKACKVLANASTSIPAGEDVIHYVKFSKPHAKDIDLVGPFYPIEDAVPRIRERLEREKSKLGLKTFNFLYDTCGISSVLAHTAPLPNDKHMRIEITNETNAAAAKLLATRKPGEAVDTWNLMTMRPNFAAFTTPESHEHVLVDEQDIYKTFLSKDEANNAAKDLLEEWKIELGEGSKIDCSPHKDDLLAGAVLPEKGIPRCLQVNHDGSKRPVEN